MKHLLAFAAMATAFLSLACTKHETQIVYQNPPDNILKSFSADCAQKNCIKIEKSSLNKTFLMIMSGKSSSTTPQWVDLKPLVVVFKKNADQIGVFSLNTNSIYDTDSSLDLVQTFQVLAEDSDSITFDWGKGLETFRQEDVMQIETNLEDGPASTSVEILNSFVNSTSVQIDKIEISQFSKVRTTEIKARKVTPLDPKSETKQMLETTESTYNINLQIYPYTINKNFKPKLADASRTVGFFVNPIAKPSYARSKQNYITKWDFDSSRGPVRFLISDNIPAEYFQAVKEGVLYWNHVLGFEAVSVEISNESQKISPLHAVTVRWIPWEDAGFAFAQIQADPLTGEILRGQVFMTPAWLQTKGAGSKLAPIVNPLTACDFSQLFSETVKDLPETAQEVRIAQDRVRGVIAHEVGHSLGLRHNFAGSSSISNSAKDLWQSLKDYLADASNTGAMSSTTVMDYIRGSDEVLMGKWIQSKPLPYDKMAMTWAYAADDGILDAKVSHYCSDEDIQLATDKYKVDIYDCRRHDSAASPFLTLINEQLKVREKLLQNKYLELLGILFPDNEPKYVNMLPRLLDENHADLQLKALKTQMSYYQSKEKVVSLEKWRNEIQRNFTSKQDPTLELILRDHLEQVGGLGNVKALLTPVPDWTKADLNAVLAQIATCKGKTKAGREFELTPEQQDQFATYFKNEAQYVEIQLQKELNEMFKGL